MTIMSGPLRFRGRPRQAERRYVRVSYSLEADKNGLARLDRLM
jgi:hypothetical protein